MVTDTEVELKLLKRLLGLQKYKYVLTGSLLATAT